MSLTSDGKMGVGDLPEPGSVVPCQPTAIWMTDVALETFIDVEEAPVAIRLAGTLDGAAGTNLVSVVEEMIADGSRDVELGSGPRARRSAHRGLPAGTVGSTARCRSDQNGKSSRVNSPSATTEALSRYQGHGPRSLSKVHSPGGRRRNM
jgi:hypothetical protein